MIVLLVIGFAPTGGSLIPRPRGLFNLVSEGTAESFVFIALGVALPTGGVAIAKTATRRLARLRNNLVRVGKAHRAIVNEPDFQPSAIGSSRNGGDKTPNPNFHEPVIPK